LTRDKYNDAAENATRYKLSPASDNDTCKHWKLLGVTRQTAHNWKKNGAPIAARLAVAWFMSGRA
jgi:hypothetical protein